MGGSAAAFVIIVLIYFAISKKMQKSEYKRIQQLQKGTKENSDNTSKSPIEQIKEKVPVPNENPFANKIKPRPNARRPAGGRNVNIYTGKDKIITFYGSKNGIGTTIASFSVAMELALRKNKVLYIEYNDENPMIASWLGVYDATNYEDGIDRAILGYETSSLKDANNAITITNIISKILVIDILD